MPSEPSRRKQLLTRACDRSLYHPQAADLQHQSPIAGHDQEFVRSGGAKVSTNAELPYPALCSVTKPVAFTSARSPAHVQILPFMFGSQSSRKLF